MYDLKKIDAQISVVDEKLMIEVKKGVISDELKLQIKVTF